MATDALAAIGLPALDPVIASLQDQEKRTRQGAALTLGKMIRPESRLRSERPTVERIKQALLLTLRDPDASVRLSTIDSLSLLTDADVIQSLKNISVRDPYKTKRGAGPEVYPVRDAAKNALANMR
jgi:HEAT repeat protein